MTTETSFGQWLKQRRKALDLTQDELAERVGCAVETIRKIEAGQRRPSRDIAEHLARELVTDPDERATVVRHARTGGGADEPARHLPDALPRNFPLPPNLLIGREREVTQVRELLAQPQMRLLTLTGPGGTGKTRLAIEAASGLGASFAQGVWWVSLAAIHEAELVATTMVQVLGVQELGGKSTVERLKEFLRDKELLVVLDNFEQVVEAAPLLADLLQAAPKLKLLVTSRIVLHLAAEHELPVPSLALPPAGVEAELAALTQYEAVALFIQRAQAVLPTFQVTNATASAVAEICHRLDGLPLAIELAAARSKLFAPKALLQHLSSPLKLLTGGARDVADRQQTLRATIAWSYDLLSVEEQQLFVQLAVFAGGWTLAAAEAICITDEEQPLDVLDGLQALLDQSLMCYVQGPDGEPRFILLETIREYALERLELSGEAAVRARHTAYYLGLAQQAEPSLWGGPDQLAWLARLEADHDNLRAAHSWGLAHPESGVAIELAGALWRFWQLNGDWTEAGRWLRAALAHSGVSHDSPARAKALCAATICDWLDGDMVTASGRVAESAAIFQAHGDQPGLALARSTQALMLMALGDGTAQRVSDEAVALARAVGDPSLLEYALHIEGELALERGDAPAAQAALEACVVHCRAQGDRWGLLINLRFLSYLALAAGNYAHAATLIDETLSLAQELGNTFEVFLALHAAGQIAQAAGDVGLAMTHYADSLALSREQGRPVDMADVLLSQAAVWQLQAAYGRATALLREALLILKDTTDTTTLAACLTGSAAGACAQRQPLPAARLLGAVHILDAQYGTPPSVPGDRWANDQVVAETRAQLDAASFATAWAEGQALTREQAIAYALAVLGS